jgi:tetratricopeptide (TPR) repeat protein
MRDALAPARKLYLVQKALNYPPGRGGPDGRLLSQIEMRLGRRDAAVATAKEVVELRRGAGRCGGTGRRAAAMGNAANEARQFETALAAYDEVLAMEECGRKRSCADRGAGRGGGDPGELGPAEAARERFEAARGASADLGDAGDGVRAVEPDRADRVALAESLRPGAGGLCSGRDAGGTRAGLEDLRLRRGWTARGFEEDRRLRRGAGACRRSGRAAREMDAPLMEADALLVASSIEWARGEYFEAFRLQRAALEIVDRI